MQSPQDDVLGPNVVMIRHVQMGEDRLHCRVGHCRPRRLQPGELLHDCVWPHVAEQIDLPIARRRCALVGQIDDIALDPAFNGSMRRFDKAFEPFRRPVIAARLLVIAVHALLDHHPSPVVGDNEAVEIEIEAVLHSGAVDFGDQAARRRQRTSIEADALANGDQLAWRRATVLAAPAADMDPKVARDRIEPAFQRAKDARGDARQMPVHAHHRAKRLEPEGMGEPSQQLFASVFEHDRFDDYGAKAGHALPEPRWYAATMQRHVGTAGAFAHQPARAQATGSAVPDLSLPNNGNALFSSLAASKFDTVTPTSLTPDCGG